MKRTILFICCIFGSFFLISSNLFAQDSFDDCFEIERLKAISEGATIEESINYAKEICNLELEQQPKQDNESTAEKNANSSETPVFVLDILFGGSRTIDGVDDQPTFGILLDYYVTPKFSLAAGYLSTRGEGDEVYRYDEAYTDYNDPSYRDENYDVQVPYQATENYNARVPYRATEDYDARVPYQATEDYNAQVPYQATEDYDARVPYQATEDYDVRVSYQATEDYDVRVPYQATENYDVQVPYYATTGASSQLVRPNVSSSGGTSILRGSDGLVTYSGTTLADVVFYYCVFKSDTKNSSGNYSCYDWDRLSSTFYGSRYEAGEGCRYSGAYSIRVEFVDRYYCLTPQRKPSTYYSTCDFSTTANDGCFRWEYDNTYKKYRTETRTREVTKYRTETRTRTVTKYRTETRTRTVTKYRTETRTRTVIKYRTEIRTRTVTKYRTETRTRTVTRYRTEIRTRPVTKYRTETRTRQMLYYPKKTRSVSQVSSVRLKNSETSLGARWHILNSNKKKSSLDLFLGFGVVSISHNRTSYLYKEQSGSGSGSYAEAGIKYIYQVGGKSYNIGYYWRNSSASFELTGESTTPPLDGKEKDWGGTTQGFIVGYAF